MLPPEDSDVLKQLADGDLDVLSNFTACGAGQPQSIRLDVFACPKCADTRLLTVQLARIAVNDSGETVGSTTAIVDRMLLNAESMARLQATLDALPMQDNSSEHAEEESAEGEDNTLV